MGAIIIGAGITGLTVAQKLSRRSIKCTILEKSKSVGGRMATRYIDTDNGRLIFDHGCSSFMLNSKLVLPCAMKMCLTLLVLDIESAHKFNASSGMNSVPKSIQKQLQDKNNVDFQFNTKVERVSRDSISGIWTVRTKDSLDNISEHICEKLYLALPCPQSLDLVGDFIVPELKSSFEKVLYNRSIVLMIVLKGRESIKISQMPFIEPFGSIIFKSNGHELAYATIYMNSNWSFENYSYSDQELTLSITQLFVKNLYKHKINPEIIAASLKKWRYATPQTKTCFQGTHYIDEKLGLSVCGDFFADTSLTHPLEQALLSTIKI